MCVVIAHDQGRRVYGARRVRFCHLLGHLLAGGSSKSRQSSAPFLSFYTYLHVRTQTGGRAAMSE